MFYEAWAQMEERYYDEKFMASTGRRQKLTTGGSCLT
ncbi:MAG: hypothetical protein IPN43_17090 [Chitinophagaceae bacterium]|nr:hypothetical protein [Chitinophagaceae bacterium]